MKKQSTKRALLMSALTMLLCMSMLVGSTFAWFTDSVTSAGNKIVAGTLDVQLLMHDGSDYADISESSAPIFGAGSLAQNVNGATLWEPGKTQVAYLAIKNNGSLALKYKVGLNVKNVAKDLYEVMEYAITPNAQPGTVTDWVDGSGTPVVLGTQAASGEVSLAVGATHYFALSVHMLEEAGNEYQGGEVNFDLTVLATQDTVEADSFDNLYDEAATYPQAGSGSAPVVPGTTWYDIDLLDTEDHKIGSAQVPATAVADGASDISITVLPTALYNGVTVAADQKAQSYDISATGLTSTSFDPAVKIELDVGTGLTGVALYHYGNPVADAVYNPISGNVIFETASFSPFTVVYDAVAQEEEGPTLPEGMPDAEMTVLDPDDFVDENGEWDWAQAPSKAQVLECVYEFVAPHDSTTIDACEYKDWICDFYVSMETEEGASVAENALTLGGYYEDYGWIGFENPMVDGNTDIPLLQSVAKNPWTYEQIATLVGTFRCGVAHNDASVHGKTFTVMLRLVNPENEAEYYNVETVKYVFNCTETH